MVTPALLRSAIGAVVPEGPAQRALALSTLVNTTGHGVFLTGAAIFLVRGAGLSAAQVGLGLTIAGVAALAAGVAIGERADRHGAREVYLATLWLQCASMVAFAFTRSFEVFLVVAVLNGVGDVGSRASRGAIIALLGGEAGRVRLRAQLRAVTNVGISVGALLAGVALAIDTTTAYVAMILADAASFAVAALLVLRVPRFAPTRTTVVAGEHRWLALGDPHYLAVTAVNAVLALNQTILTIGLPLWIAGHTTAPRWIVAPLMLVNTLAVVAFQVRASRAIDDPVRAAVALRRAGLVFAAAWVVFGLTDGSAPGVAVVLLVVGMAGHTLAELWHSAAGFELSFGLARADAQGQYQGVFGLGEGLARSAAPLLSTGILLAYGLAGWAALGLALVAAGAAAPAVVARAQASRGRWIPARKPPTPA